MTLSNLVIKAENFNTSNLLINVLTAKSIGEYSKDHIVISISNHGLMQATKNIAMDHGYIVKNNLADFDAFKTNLPKTLYDIQFAPDIDSASKLKKTLDNILQRGIKDIVRPVITLIVDDTFTNLTSFKELLDDLKWAYSIGYECGLECLIISDVELPDEFYLNSDTVEGD